MRILIRTSKWAIWSRRFGSLAVPLTVLPVILHRQKRPDGTDFLSLTDFFRIEALAMGVAALGLALGIGAYVRIWQSGDRGWGRATMGIVLALFCLSPLFYVGYSVWKYPPVDEVTTDWADPPMLIGPAPALAVGPAVQQQVAEAFPNARTRSYLIDAPALYALVLNQVGLAGWTVLDQVPPADPLGTGTINAGVSTLLGWRDEVALRVTGGPDGASVAMRSRTWSAPHDLGVNGQRIEAFLVALDKAVTDQARNNPAPALPEEDPDAGAEGAPPPPVERPPTPTDG